MNVGSNINEHESLKQAVQHSLVGLALVEKFGWQPRTEEILQHEFELLMIALKGVSGLQATSHALASLFLHYKSNEQSWPLLVRHGTRLLQRLCEPLEIKSADLQTLFDCAALGLIALSYHDTGRVPLSKGMDLFGRVSANEQWFSTGLLVIDQQFSSRGQQFSSSPQSNSEPCQIIRLQRNNARAGATFPSVDTHRFIQFKNVLQQNPAADQCGLVECSLVEFGRYSQSPRDMLKLSQKKCLGQCFLMLGPAWYDDLSHSKSGARGHAQARIRHLRQNNWVLVAAYVDDYKIAAALAQNQFRYSCVSSKFARELQDQFSVELE